MIDRTRTSPDKQWRPCPAGLLQQMAPVESQRPILGSFSTGVVLGLLIAVCVCSYSMWNEGRVRPPGNLYCHQVQMLISDYSNDLLDAKTTQQMQQHLAACPECRSAFEQLAFAEMRLLHTVSFRSCECCGHDAGQQEPVYFVMARD